MRFVCLGYMDETKWVALSQQEQESLMEECFAYDDLLRRNGHFAGGEALQSASTAATLRWRDGQVQVTDGPFSEAKELLGGILFLEAKDMQEAIALMSKHPGVRIGPFEVRPADTQIHALVEARGRAAEAR